MSDRHAKIDTFYRFSLGFYLFALVLALYSGTNDPTIHIKDLLTAWAAMVLAGSYLVVCWVTGKPIRRPAVFLEVIICLLAFFLASTAFSDYFRYSLLETGQFFSLFALYWLATQLFSRPEQALRLFTVFCAAVFTAGLYAVMQKAGVDPFPWGDTESDTYTNLPATFGNPNYAAHAIILALIMVVCLVRSGATWAGWVFVPVLLFHLISTGQRAGWIALAGGAVLAGLGYLLVRQSRRPVVATAGTLLLFALLGAGAVGAAMYWTQLQTGHVFPLDLSLLLRYQSYVSATNMLFDAPVLGHGPAVYGVAYSQFWTPYEQAWFAQEMRVNEHVHNDLLELAIDGGLAAAGLYLTMLILGAGFGLMLAARGNTPLQRRLGLTFAAFFAAFAIDGLFGFNLRVPVTAALFFIMMGVLDSLWRNARPDAESDKPAPAWMPALRIAFLVLLVAAAWQETRRFVSEYHFQQATRARNDGDLDGAMSSYQQAQSHARWNWEIPGHMGLVELDRRRPDLALRYFQDSLSKNPQAFLTHLPAARTNLMLAQVAMAQEGGGNTEAAATFLDKAREEATAVFDTAPDFPAANDLLGRVESVAAIVSRGAEGAAPGAEQAHWALARTHFQDAIDAGAENTGELYRLLMRVESALGDIDAAERALASALRAAPGERENWTTFFEFARTHDRFAQFRDLLYRTIDELQGQDTLNADQQAQLGEAYAWLAAVLDEGFGDVGSAIEAYAGAVSHAPGRADLWNRFATYAQRNGREDGFRKALQATCDAIEVRGESPLPQVKAVDLALEDPGANLDAASRTLLGAIRGQIGQSSLPLLLAYGWAATTIQSVYDAQFEAGAAPCESALNLGIVAANLGGASAGGLELAAKLLERAHGCLEGEERAAAAVHWADSLTRLGKAGEALALLRQSEAEFPGHLDTRWGIARALAQSGDIEGAQAAYRALLDDESVNSQARELVRRELEGLQPQSP